jgi:two-component system nitrogen regulation sensor histidine kinase GlnL
LIITSTITHTDGISSIGPSAAELLNGLATAVLLLDKGRHVHYLNSAAERLLNKSANRAVGQLADELLGMGAILQGAVLAATTGNTTTFREIEIQQGSMSRGKEQPVRVDCTVSQFPGGLDSAWVLAELVEVEPLAPKALGSDWREHHVATNEIIQALAYGIKNPLGGLRGAAQLLSRELSNSDLQGYTDIITRESDRLTKLVDRMVGPRKLNTRELFNLHEVLEHVRHLIEAEFKGKVEIQRDYDPSIPDATGHKEYLIQAILNVARNAAQAVDGQGDIWFRTRVRRQFTVGQHRYRHVLEASIRDAGPGIPFELQEKIFLPMITSRPDGAGLGLALARDMVNRQGGAIECTSCPGDTQFKIFLPVVSNS